MQGIWDYPTGTDTEPEHITTESTNLVGFSVEAQDGSIGKIDDATYETEASYVVVDTGPWIFGQKVLVPAGVIESIDYADETVHVNRTKDEIRNSPRFGDVGFDDPTYREELGMYYGANDMTHKLRPDFEGD